MTRKDRKGSFLPPIKRYVNAVERKLNLPFQMKVRVMSDFTTSIGARHEAGESYEEIMASLGTPREAAAQLSEQLSEYAYHKSPWRFVFLGVALLGAAGLVGWLLWQQFAPALSFGTAAIGGADGPTAISVSSGGGVWGRAAVCLALLLAGFLGFFRLSRLKRRGRRD